MVKFLDNLKESVDEIRVKNGFEKSQSLDIVKCVRDMLTEIFSYLKTTIDKKLTPQRKIIIETNSQLQSLDDDLPSDAKLKPDGTGNPMQVFGLPSEEITWSQFISSVKDNKFGDSWRAAIVSVITSSLPNQIDVDNSQIIVSSDERHVYRLILTTSTTYYDKKREFHLYFVESPPRTDYGYRDTTLLLKGLGLVCRFRFMFLEEDSVFYSKNFLAQSLEKIPSLAREMIMELNLLLRDSREAGLDQPNVWSNFIVWETLLDMSEQWLPRERKIREIVARIRSNKNDQDLAQLRDELAAALGDMERTTRPYNRLLIEQMTDRLRGIVDSEEKSPNADPSRSKMGPHLVAPSSPTDSRDQK